MYYTFIFSFYINLSVLSMVIVLILNTHSYISVLKYYSSLVQQVTIIYNGFEFYYN